MYTFFQGLGSTVCVSLRKEKVILFCLPTPNLQVQTGFGRTGSHYWGFQGHGVIPDMVTMAKGIANGFPMGAVVTTPGKSSFQGLFTFHEIMKLTTCSAVVSLRHCCPFMI